MQTVLHRLSALFLMAVSLLARLESAYAEAPLDASEAADVAVEAYVYAYPLVLMDVSRRAMTNVAEVTPDGQSPMNQFGHKRTFPDATFTDVVRPNADTLYSSLWFDVSREPLVISVGDSGGRYYLLPMLDMWTDIFASPGKRTTGTQAGAFAIVGPKWTGTLPDGVQMLRAPTAIGWLIGRTQTNGKGDYENVHKFQDELKAAPLSAWGKPYAPPRGEVDPNVPKKPPVEVVAEMDAAEFFARFAQLTVDNPPHANDYPVLARMKRLGLEPGKPFDLAQTSPEAQAAWSSAPRKAQAKIIGYLANANKNVNGWAMILNPVGTYGTDYLKRALIAYAGLGANVVEDAIYPTAFAFAGKPFDSAKRYVLHFQADQIPPARAFWSLTMYNERQFFVANPINRFAIGDRDALKFAADGSLTLYIQRDSPGGDRESNWLPAPQEGSFSMNLRLYWPKPAALDGTWQPPAFEEAAK